MFILLLEIKFSFVKIDFFQINGRHTSKIMIFLPLWSMIKRIAISRIAKKRRGNHSVDFLLIDHFLETFLSTFNRFKVNQSGTFS